MIKTTEEIENYIFPLSKLLNLENEPKWVLLRFMMDISLSLNRGFVDVIPKNLDGKEYRLEQITGEGKDEDYTRLYESMIEEFSHTSIDSKKRLELFIQQHIYRGYTILKTSLKHDSNIFEFLAQDFFTNNIFDELFEMNEELEEIYDLEEYTFSHILPNGDGLYIDESYIEPALKNGYELEYENEVVATNIKTKEKIKINTLRELTDVMGIEDIWEHTEASDAYPVIQAPFTDFYGNTINTNYFCNNGKDTIFLISENETNIFGIRKFPSLELPSSINIIYEDENTLIFK